VAAVLHPLVLDAAFEANAAVAATGVVTMPHIVTACNLAACSVPEGRGITPECPVVHAAGARASGSTDMPQRGCLFSCKGVFCLMSAFCCA
jgi:hypothetical protein